MDIEEEEEENTKYCTNCKHNIKTNVYEMHVLHCHRRIKLCPVCNEPVPKEQMEEHHEDNHTEAPCDLCGLRIMKDQLEDHQTNDCRERKIECKYCQLEVKAVDFMEHTAACGSRTDVCDKCLTRLMLKDMDDHKCGEPPPPMYNQYHTPPRPRPAGTRRAIRVDVDEVEQTQAREPERRADDASDQLRRDEEMAAELQAQYTNEDPNHHIGPTNPLSPNSHLIQDTHYSPTTSPHDRAVHDTGEDLLSEQLQFEMRTGTRGQPTMVLYNYAMSEEEKKKRNGDSPGSPIVLNEEDSGGEKEEEEEERRREQLRRDEEMARQLQEEEEVENQIMLARFGQAVTYRNSPSPPPLLNTGGGGEGERREDGEEEGVLIPCEICQERVLFEDYEKHTNEKHSYLAGYVRNNTHPPPPQRYSSPERRRTTSSSSSSSPPTKHSPKKTEDGDIRCSYCRFKYSPDVITYHETICDMNPDRGLSKRQLPSPKVNEAIRGRESPLGPTRQLENLTRSTDDSEEDDGIPCQFCEHLFPLSEIGRHQRTCQTRFNTRYVERDGRGSPRSYGIFGANFSDERKARSTYNSAPVPTSATKKTTGYGGASATSHSSTTQKMRLTSDPTTRRSLENKTLAESNVNRSRYVYTTNSGATGGVGYGGGRRGGGGGGGTRGRERGGTRPGAERERGRPRGTEGGTRGRGRGREGNSRGGGSLLIDVTGSNNGNKTGDNGRYGLFIEGTNTTNQPHATEEDDDEMEVDLPYIESDGSSKGNSFTKRRK